jgi:hypothetical protein
LTGRAGGRGGARRAVGVLGRLGCCAAFGLMGLFAGPGAAVADGADGAEEAPVAWSVAPAGPAGPDGRHRVELELEPGQRAEDHFAVTNQSMRAAVFAIQAADGYFTAQGRFNMLDQPGDSVDAGTWIDVERRVEVGPGETVVVPFSVDVPAGAEPGDHAAGIAAALTSAEAAEGDEPGMGVVSRFGFRVMVRVAGELRPGLEIRQVGAAYDLSWNPFKPGRLVVGFDLANTGNTRLLVTGEVSAGVGGQGGVFPAADAVEIELLPGDSRRVQVAVGRVWPLFAAKVVVGADPEVLALEGAGPVPLLARVTASATAWTVPWPQLALAAGLALLVWARLAGRRRSRRRLAALLEQTRAEERARLLAEATGRADPAAGAPANRPGPGGGASANWSDPAGGDLADRPDTGGGGPADWSDPGGGASAAPTPGTEGGQP